LPIDALVWECHADREQEAVPIGRPIANTQAYLLDRDLQPLPVGVIGELYLGGVGLARGYLHRPDRTAERFLPNPFGVPGSRFYRTGDLGRYRPDGVIEFVGRTDHQVKLRGYRIELGEIEARLSGHPAIRNVCVVMREERLVAYIVLHAPLIGEGRREGDGHAETLRAYLSECLPAYMVPARYTFLETLPRTVHGKVDRNNLPPPSAVGSAVRPRYILSSSWILRHSSRERTTRHRSRCMACSLERSDPSPIL